MLYEPHSQKHSQTIPFSTKNMLRAYLWIANRCGGTTPPLFPRSFFHQHTSYLIHHYHHSYLSLESMILSAILILWFVSLELLKSLGSPILPMYLHHAVTSQTIWRHIAIALIVLVLEPWRATADTSRAAQLAAVSPIKNCTRSFAIIEIWCRRTNCLN